MCELSTTNNYLGNNMIEGHETSFTSQYSEIPDYATEHVIESEDVKTVGDDNKIQVDHNYQFDKEDITKGLTNCPKCGMWISEKSLEKHLKRSHSYIRPYQGRGLSKDLCVSRF